MTNHTKDFIKVLDSIKPSIEIKLPPSRNYVQGDLFAMEKTA